MYKLIISTYIIYTCINISKHIIFMYVMYREFLHAQKQLNILWILMVAHMKFIYFNLLCLSVCIIRKQLIGTCSILCKYIHNNCTYGTDWVIFKTYVQKKSALFYSVNSVFFFFNMVFFSIYLQVTENVYKNVAPVVENPVKTQMHMKNRRQSECSFGDDRRRTWTWIPGRWVKSIFSCIPPCIIHQRSHKHPTQSRIYTDLSLFPWLFRLFVYVLCVCVRGVYGVRLYVLIDFMCDACLWCGDYSFVYFNCIRFIKSYKLNRQYKILGICVHDF